MQSIEADESDYLYTGTSQLSDAGFGLHTAIDIFRGEIIAYYHGETLTDSQAKIRAGAKNDQYFIMMPDGKILDSKHSECFAKFANDASAFAESGFKNNAKIALDDDDRVCLIAMHNIKKGDEIFCNYGKRYWKKHG